MTVSPSPRHTAPGLTGLSAPPPLPGGTAQTFARLGLTSPEFEAAASSARPRVLTPYVVLWSLLATATVAYLGYVVVSPEARMSAGSSYDTRFATRVVGDVTSIKEAISQVQIDLAKIKADMAGQDQRTQVLSAAVTALELRLPADDAHPGTQAAAPEPTKPAVAPPAKTATNLPKPSPATDAGNQARPEPEKPRIVNAQDIVQPADLGLETGSLEAVQPQVGGKTDSASKAVKAAMQPLDLGAAVVKPAPKPVGVQISSGASVDSLRLSWSLLADRHGDTLKNLEPRYVTRGDDASPSYDLVVGPIKSKADAQKVCKSLAAKNVPCKVGDFAGEAL